MKKGMFSFGSIGLFLIAVLLVVMLASSGQCRGNRRGGGSSSSSSNSSPQVTGPSDPSKPFAPTPYEGQTVCPVCGRSLGSEKSAESVDTGIGAQKPTVIGKLCGRQEVPGLAIYVCGPECAAKVRTHAVEYFGREMRTSPFLDTGVLTCSAN